MAVATLLALAADGTPLPAGAVLLSPWLDLTLTAGSLTTVDDPLLDVAVLAASAAAYAGDDVERPLVSPVRAPAEQLAALPPLLVLAGTGDRLVDDSRTLAERARSAGIEVELDVADDLIHVWPLFDGLPETDAALTRIAAWVGNRTAG